MKFLARGHPNVRCGHRTTLMVTKDPHVSTRGDCVAAVGAEVSLSDLPGEFKEAARSPDTVITLTLETGPHRFAVEGRGHPELTYAHTRDMVARRSGYACSRTLMIDANKAAEDVPREMVTALQSPGSAVEVTLTMKEASRCA